LAQIYLRKRSEDLGIIFCCHPCPELVEGRGSNFLNNSCEATHFLNPQSLILNPIWVFITGFRAIMLHKVDSILIIAPSWVGDVVMSQALYQLIKTRHDAFIDILAPKALEPIVAHIKEVRHFHPMPIGHGKFCLLQRYRLGKVLQQYHYDQVIVLPNSWKSALIPFFAKIPKRTGFLGEWRFGLLNDIRSLNKKHLPLMVERFLSLGVSKNKGIPKKYAYPALFVDSEQQQNVMQKLGLKLEDQRILVLCPGAQFGPSKRWPPEYFSVIATMYHKKGWSVWILGADNERAIADTIQKETKGVCVNFLGKTQLDEAIVLMSLANLVVTNDSGLMRIAAALKRPLVAIYGSSSPEFTPPLTKAVTIACLNLSCSPCFKRQCPLKHLRCMRDLTPDKVLKALEELEDT